jgi:hypothetical protein
MKLEYLRVGHCPVCDCKISPIICSVGEMPHPFDVVNIYLNNGSFMPQPVCIDHSEAMKSRDMQEMLLRFCIMLWCKEILENIQWDNKQKTAETKRVKALRVRL